LRVKVNHQGAQTLTGADGSQITSDGGLANPPFLIEHDDRHTAAPQLKFIAKKVPVLSFSSTNRRILFRPLPSDWRYLSLLTLLFIR
jgi:hypothetical protein